MGDGARSWGTRVAARPHLAAGLLLGACVLGYLWPVLVGGKILSPLAILYSWPPWRGLAPSDVSHYYNSLLVDLPLVDYPWRVLARSFIHEGTFPAWNPYALGGIPFYSNPQTGIFSPFNLPLWILPLTYGLGVAAAAKLFTGAFGAYLLVRQLRLGFLPGLLAGIAFAFSATNVVWLAHETLPGVVVMLPWAIWLVERIFEGGRPASMLALAAVVAIGLGGGHPGMQVELLLVIAAYALVRAACQRGRSADRDVDCVPLGRALALVAGGIAAGVALMAFMLLPEALSSQGTVGVVARHSGELPSSRMPFRAVATTIFPDWWGRPSAFEAPLNVANASVLQVNYCERTFYAGTVALLLALVGVAAPGGRRRKLPFALVGAVALAVTVHVPGIIWAARHVPLLSSVEPERLHFAFEFCVAVLAAFGLQAIIDGAASGRQRLGVVLAAAFVGGAAFFATGASGDDVRHTLRHFLSGTDYRDTGVLALTAVGWFLFFALAVGGLLLLLRLRPRWRTGLAVALVLLATMDAYRFVHGFQPMGPASRVVPPVTPALAYLQRHRAEGRVVGVGDVLPPDTGLVLGLRDARGYDPPNPTVRMLRLWRRVNSAQPSWKPLRVDAIDVPHLHVLGALGVRLLVTEPGTTFSRHAFPYLKTVYDGDDATVIANAQVAPRAYVPVSVRVTADRSATEEAIAEARFDPRTEVAVERDQPGVASLDPANGSAAVVVDRNARVAVRARLNRRGLVVLDDSLMPGWSVRVDGRAATPLHVNSVMRGVIVPAGRHEVVWSYRVPGLRAGALVSAVTLLLFAGAAIGFGVRSRRRAGRTGRSAVRAAQSPGRC